MYRVYSYYYVYSTVYVPVHDTSSPAGGRVGVFTEKPEVSVVGLFARWQRRAFYDGLKNEKVVNGTTLTRTPMG